MKRMLIAAITAALLILAGCALIDSLLGETEAQAISDDGLPVYETHDGRLTTEPADAAGRLNKPRMVRLVRPDGAGGVAGLAAQFGPWGALIGAVATGAFGLYARLRNKQRLNEQGLRKQAQSQLDETASALAFTVRLIEQIKTAGPEIDRDGDGKVSFEEIKGFVRDRGERFTNPDFLAQVVRLANVSLSPRSRAST